MKIKLKDLRPMSEMPIPKKGKEWGRHVLLCFRSEWDGAIMFHEVRLDKDGNLTTWFGCIDLAENEPLGWVPWPEFEEE